MRYRFATLQRSLFIGFSLVIGLILAVCFLFFYAYFSVYSEETVSNRHKNLCSSIAEALDAELSKMNTVSMNIVYSNLISANFRDYLVIIGSQPDSIGKWRSALSIFDMIWAIIGPFQTVSQVNIYAPNGAVVGAGLYNMEDKVRLEDKSWYEPTMRLGGSRYIGPPESIPSLELRNALLKDHEFVPLCRVFSSDRFVTTGIVEVLQDANTLFAPVERVRRLNPEIEVFVLDEEGRQVYPFSPNSSSDGAFYALSISDQGLAPLRMNAMAGPSKEGTKVATFIRSDFSLWQVVVVEPKKTAYLPLRRFNTILAAASFAMLALGWFATYLTARRLTIPLKQLQKALAGMDAADLVDTRQTTPDIGHASVHEIDELASTFYDMYEKLRFSTKELVEMRSEEMKARMLALQSLMNPHFIYNNLAAIGAMADEGLTVEIKNMCDDVSQILRYVSSDAENGVTLADELDHCEKYLKCMKIRHGDRLSYAIEIPDEMLDIVVPKLVVQPLVENSIKHGFEVSGPWHLAVRGYVESGEWRVEVSDNGIGFDPDAVKRLYAQLGEWADSGKLPPLRIDGMGLLNIGLRLRLLYGEDHLFDIAETMDGGARLTIGGRIGGR